jgi:hypothetical protein
LQTWRLLGVILALCPKISSLFMLQGCRAYVTANDLPGSPELDALQPLLWHPGGQDDPVIPGPAGHGFLEDLQQLTIETHDHSRTSDYTRFIAFYFLTNSSRLRRVEIKGDMATRGLWTLFKQYPHCNLRAAYNVKELALLRTEGPCGDLLATVMAFPRLVSLQAEYDNFSYVRSLHNDPALPSTISSALLRLSDTLETLSMTTRPGPPGSLYQTVLSYPPYLTGLNQMGRIKDLTTQALWLFGREDANIALQLPHLLPPSLVSLRLIDYWGSAHETQHYFLPHDCRYYPVLPNNWSPITFYYNVLMTLVVETTPTLPDLREVTLVSTQLCEELHGGTHHGSSTLGGQADMMVSTEEAMSKLYEALQSVGIRFNLEMQVENEQVAARFEWARIC